MKIFLIYIMLLFCVSSCKKDTSSNLSKGQSDNQWIYTQMEHYYFWNRQLPKLSETNLSKTTPEYFIDLLYNRRSIYGDRFSVIREKATAKSAKTLSDNTYTYGLGYKGRIVSFNNNLYFQLLQVIPSSPAALKGLKRGDLFSKVNGSPIKSELINTLHYSDNITLTKCNVSFQDLENISIVAKEYTNTPILFCEAYHFSNTSIGYLVYNHFSPGSNDMFVKQLKNAFDILEKNEIKELILDLRYNPGGEVNLARLLASMIVKREKVVERDVFANLEYNSVYGEELRRRNSEYNIMHFALSDSDLKQYNLDLSRVYVIATNNSASASELIIHCLRQHMNVIHAGSNTMGKNLGSITIHDPENIVKWELHPIVAKIWDKNNSPSYEAGLKPNIEIDENYISIGDWGDYTREPMLNQVLNKILSANRISARSIAYDSDSTVIVNSEMPIENIGIIINHDDMVLR